MAYFDYTVQDIINAVKEFDWKKFDTRSNYPGRCYVNKKLYKKFLRQNPSMFANISQFCKIALMIKKGKKIRKVISCPICGERNSWGRKTCKKQSCLVSLRKKTLFDKNGNLNCTSPETREKQRQTLMKNYGVTSPFASKEIRQKGSNTLKLRYGVDNPMKSETIRKKAEGTNLITYGAACVLSKGSTVRKKLDIEHEDKWGVKTPFERKDLQKKLQDHRRLPETEAKIVETKRKNGTFNTSNSEDKSYLLLLKCFPKVTRQYSSKKYPFACDFYIPQEKLYIECNYHWTHGKEPYTGTRKQRLRASELLKKGTRYATIAHKVWTISDVAKRERAKRKGLNWIEFFRFRDFEKWLNENFAVKVKQLRPGKRPKEIDVPMTAVKGPVSERFRLLYEHCLNSPFPGTKKWPWNHTIWKCRISKSVSPWKAWQDPIMIEKAVNNLEKIWDKSEREEKYKNYIDRWSNAIQEGGVEAARVVLNRFTVAKIAPKVTALSETSLIRILEEANKDYSKGIYCPMAGFGGIVRAALSLGVEVEAYDINKKLNKWYGWTYRNVLAKKIKTDKLVVVCPPFGERTERWLGTPSNMYYSFEEWCSLIRKYVKAPDYVFIGPEKKSKNKCGLFGKSIGVQWYPIL